jgi:hypothetical protein
MGAALNLDSRIVGSIHDSSADWGESWIDADPFRPVTGAHRQNDLLRLAALAAEVEAGAVRAQPPGPRTLRCSRGALNTPLMAAQPPTRPHTGCSSPPR